MGFGDTEGQAVQVLRHLMMSNTHLFYYLGRFFFALGGFGLGGATIGAILSIHQLQQGTAASPTDWITGLGGLGVGGIIAGIVITWKRQDDTAHVKQLEAVFARLEALSDRVLEAFETNTKTVGQLAVNSTRDSADRHNEHDQLGKTLDRLEKTVNERIEKLEDQMGMISAGVQSDRRHSGGRSSD